MSALVCTPGPTLRSDPAPTILRAGELMAFGSFASPVGVGPAARAAGSLLRSFGSRFGDPGSDFEADVYAQCTRFSEDSGALSISAQLLQKTPEGLGGYSHSAEGFHVDMLPEAPATEGLRMVRVFYGPGTQWIPAEALPAELQRSRCEGEMATRIKSYTHWMRRLDQDPPSVCEVPQGSVILYRGGLGAGLVHRAPPCLRARLILVVSALTL